jgi:predicted SAM-dependent methyltransferase
MAYINDIFSGWIRNILNKVKIFNSLRDWRYLSIEKKNLRRIIVSHPSPLRIIIGSGGDSFDGWISTDYPSFDITKQSDWKYFFAKHKIDNLLAEHVFEHLSIKEVEKSLNLSFQYLKQGGIFRIAVPDGFHPDLHYIEYVKPGGSGPGSDDHKILFNYKTLFDLAKKNKFSINLIEYFDEDCNFNSNNNSPVNGLVKRNKKDCYNHEIKNYSSLIVDLIKE